MPANLSKTNKFTPVKTPPSSSSSLLPSTPPRSANGISVVKKRHSHPRTPTATPTTTTAPTIQIKPRQIRRMLQWIVIPLLTLVLIGLQWHALVHYHLRQDSHPLLVVGVAQGTLLRHLKSSQETLEQKVDVKKVSPENAGPITNATRTMRLNPGGAGQDSLWATNPKPLKKGAISLTTTTTKVSQQQQQQQQQQQHADLQLLTEHDNNALSHMMTNLSTMTLPPSADRQPDSGGTSSTSTSSSSARHSRHFPDRKIVYLLHIHKSGGTTMCLLANANQLATSAANCNVQRDQRCCGHANTVEAQVAYATTSRFDLVASEGRMYDGMDLEHYSYILVLRQSHDRYFSHWKHVRQTLEQFMQDEELPAVGGRRHDRHGGHHRDYGNHEPTPPPPPIKTVSLQDIKQLRQQQQQEQLQHDTDNHIDNDSHKQEDIDHDLQGLGLVRESKQERLARRQEKLRQMQAFKHDLEQQVHEMAHLQQDVSRKRQEELDAQAARLDEALKDWTNAKLDDFTMDAKDHNQHQRRLIQVQRRQLQDHGEDEDESQEGDEDQGQDEDSEESDPKDKDRDTPQEQKPFVAVKPRDRPSKARRRQSPPIHTIPHPAEDPINLEHGMSILDSASVVGKTFAEWRIAQPDNWNVRQLCGTHCQGIPKYQLRMEDWNWTVQRLLQFDVILFLEDFQQSVDVLAQRVGWNVTDLVLVQAASQEQAEKKAIQKELKRRKKMKKLGGTGSLVDTSITALTEWFQTTQKEHPNGSSNNKQKQRALEKMKQEWDPLMSALDDALYHVGQRWEALKQLTGQSSQQLLETAPDQVADLMDIQQLPEPLLDIFELYMDDQEGNHRYQCRNECCAKQCSAW